MGFIGSWLDIWTVMSFRKSSCPRTCLGIRDAALALAEAAVLVTEVMADMAAESG